MYGLQALRLSLLALRQNSETTHETAQLTHRNPHIQPSNPCSETSKRREESINSPTNSCQRFCVMNAPKIYQLPAFAIECEFLAAIQAPDVGPSAIDKSPSG